MQYITPKGGPKSANHVDPNSFIVLPNWHSEKKKKKTTIIIMNFQRRRLDSDTDYIIVV
jgi:hypothetical protein